MNEVYRAWGPLLKCALNNRRLVVNEKMCLYEGVIIPTALYEIVACCMRSAERRKVNVVEIKCLRSLVGVSRMERVRKEGVHMRGCMH